MTLLSLIVVVLMSVFNSTQQAFRAGVTQTDVLEGSRAAVDLITTDLRTLAPSYDATNASVNFLAMDNGEITSVNYTPLSQNLPGSSFQRANVLNFFFVLGRNNTKWTAVGYVVNATNHSPLYPLYRFYAETNISVPPAALYAAFTNAVNYSQWTNMSHVMDGVVSLSVRAFDPAGYRMTNTAYVVVPSPNGITNFHDNVYFRYPPSPGEVGFRFYSNAVPAAVELQMGVLEDRALQRAESLPYQSAAQSSYLAQQSGKVHLFRERVTIPNVDPSAYLPPNQ